MGLSGNSNAAIIELSSQKILLKLSSSDKDFTMSCETYAHAPFPPGSGLHTFCAHVHAGLLRDKVVVAPTAAWVDKLLTRLGGCIIVIARYGGWTLPFVQRIPAEHGDCCNTRNTTQGRARQLLFNHFLVNAMTLSIVYPHRDDSGG